MPGEVSGAVPGYPFTRDGGLGIFVNGAPQGVRPNTNLLDTPGMSWSAADNPGANRVDVTARFDGEVELGTATGLDLGAGGVLQDLIAALAVTRAQVTRILVIAENVNTVAVQPTVEAGTDNPGNPPNDDVAPSQALALTATGQVQELALANPRPSITQVNPFDVLTLRQTVAATAVAYVVGVRVFGTVVDP